MVDLRSSFTGKDRWSFKPGLVSLLTVTALNLLCSLPGSVSFLLIPLSLLGYSIALIAILAITIYFVIKKRPRRGASVVLVVLLPVLLWSLIRQKQIQPAFAVVTFITNLIVLLGWRGMFAWIAARRRS